ncbi:aldehyde dehydrogenase family protein [Arthrobacter sp. I2-34]|uniref:Aldehyde dehydrogenase family protein n=1 Tax=Arthrobacter hankyongi TaxID=2904801 RepID=A0ABS9L3M2_9MICC|nr:aldehyde dehydrogenase family protein [Arthrobacter hankyongi]MCG2621289.1 aldehyde dehydrogenase family protein [Arthrobacter hankyongi]
MNSADFQLVSGADLSFSGVVNVYNPARIDEAVGTIPRMAGGDVDKVVQAAHRAQPGWAALSPVERYERIAQALAAIDMAGADELLTREHGKVRADAARELKYLDYPVKFLQTHLQWLAEGEDLGDNGMHHTKVYRAPYGVVGLLTPWNVPIGMGIITIAPALLAGNSVIAHVPVTAPLTVLRIFGQLAAALPKGVLSLISSPDTAVAQALVEHPLVRNVHFTGSTPIGALVAKEAADTMTTVTLELGGNDPAVVLDDALDDAAIYGRFIAAAFPFGGQACIALKRLYVPKARVGEVVEGLGAALTNTVVGDGLDPATTMGPLHTAVIRDNVKRLLEEARAAGGTVQEYGMLASDPDKGYFMLPAVVSGLENSASVVAEEQFGPVLPVIGYDSVDEAIAMANDSEYGLGSSVWSADVEYAARVAGRIDAGMTWINAHGGAGVDGRAPWGGVKLSGTGRGGANRAGLEGFTEAHAVIMPGSGVRGA